jgi:hypothetical protein
VRVGAGDPHPEGLRSLGDDQADPPEADDPEGLAPKLRAAESCPLPLAGPDRGIGGGHVASHGEQERKRVLGRRDRVAVRGIQDREPGRPGRLDVDVVQPDTGACHDALSQVNDEVTSYVTAVQTVDTAAKAGEVPSTDDINTAKDALGTLQASKGSVKAACFPS